MMDVKLEEYARIPDRAYEDDAGADLFAPYDVMIEPGKSVVINTGVHAKLPFEVIRCKSRLPGEEDIYKKRKTFGLVCGKSGLATKHGIVAFMGIIDFGYTGPIAVMLINTSDKPYQIHAGDKIAQLLVIPVLTPNIHQIDEIWGEESERGENGFGSTGK